VHPRTLALLAGPGGRRLAALEDATRRRFFLVPAEGHAHLDHFEVLAEGRRDDLAPEAPVAEGAELELKLVELALHEATAAVGKVDGFVVVVADAAKLVGKKATVTVGRVLEAQAFATLVAAEPAVAPITFESEAEKPTRAPARRKSDEPATIETEAEELQAEELEVEELEAEELQAEEPSEDEDEAVGDRTDDVDGASPKKRTRRGSRGGKRRRKPATAAEGGVASEPAQGDGDAAEAEDDAEREAAAAPPASSGEPPRPRPKSRPRKPKIHVPHTDATAAPVAEAPDAAPADVVSGEQGTDAASDPGSAPEREQPAAGDGAPRKRTRRGSRGGKNRRKRAAANGDGATVPAEPVGDAAPPTADEVPAVPVPAASEAGGGEGGYVPMSEWIEDFDRRP